MSLPKGVLELEARRGNVLPLPPPSQELPVAIDADEFLALDLPPRRWHVEGLIREKDAVMLHAWRGTGKTYVVASIAWSLTSGERFLRFDVPHPTGVLWIDGEMPREDLQERLARIAAGSTRDRQAPLRILAADMLERGLPSLATREGQAMVNHNLDACPGIGLVIVDNISTLASSGSSENDAESWQAVQDFILSLRRRGVASLWVHHSNKAGGQRGTSKREDVLNQVLELRRPSDYREEEGARFELRWAKARGAHGDLVRPLELALQETPDGGLVWSWKFAEAAQRQRIQELHAEGVSARDIATEIGVHFSTVYRALGKNQK